MAMIDALDGSSMVAANGAAGTILALRKIIPDVPIEEQSGKEILASVIISHNITPRMFIAIEGMGAHEFILDGNTFYHLRKIDFNAVTVDPAKGVRFAFGQDPLPNNSS